MVVVTFPDPESHVEALGFLVSHFSGRALGTGEVIIPETALAALAMENFKFTVHGRPTYEQMVSYRFKKPVT